MAELQNLCKRVKNSTGLQHNYNLITLRRYLDSQGDDNIKRQINQITETDYIRVLWEAGLNNDLQEIALERLKRIGGE